MNTRTIRICGEVALTDLELLRKTQQRRLEELAGRQVAKGRSGGDVILVAIDVDDPAWSELVEALMPGFNWQAIRDRGERPIARGAVQREGIVKLLVEAVPVVGQILRARTPSAGLFHAVVFAGGGADAFELAARPEPS